MTRAIVLTPQMTGADGVSAMSRQVAGALATQIGQGVESVDVWSLTGEQQPDGPDPRVRVRTARGSRMVFASFGLRELDVNSDTLVVVLHAHLLPVTLPLARRGARIVPLLLGIEAWKPFTRLERAAFRRAWRVASISQHTIGRFRAANPALAGIPIRVCHPGLSSGTTRTQGAHGKHPTTALIVGRMSSDERYKGHDELLEAWPQVRAAVPSARLVVVGTGDDEARLVAKAASLGLNGAVLFEGRVDDARLAALYRDAACFVMPSRDEGFGLVYLEAMRAGTPCVAAPGAAEEIIEHGVTGLIVDPADRAALAAAVVRLFTDAEERESMGRAAARRVSERFGEAAFASRLFDVLDLPAVPATC